LFLWKKAIKIEQLKIKKMEHKAKSIRPFIGAKNYDISRRFYRDLGFQESIISPNMSYFQTDGFGFYLQNAYVKDWIDNTMIFMEVEDVKRFFIELSALELPAKYDNVRLTPIRELPWGRECFLHDPSGILWHFGEFNPM
jgi:catechol 2,3-dioxygenase-like lactoylglutathione lyase family enzyme